MNSQADWKMIFEVLEAIEKVQKYLPVYRAVLKHTGDKKQALDAVLFVAKAEDELELENIPLRKVC